MIKRSVLIVLVSFFWWGCTPSQNIEVNPKLAFFDVEDYFSRETDRLLERRPTVEKYLVINGKSEVVRPDSIDFAKELAIFSNSGINKVSWQESYRADTVFGENQNIIQTSYIAQDDKLRTRLVEVHYQNDAPAKIVIRNETKNIVLKASQELVYEPGIGFTIDQSQKLQFMSANKLRIQVDFLK